MSTLSMVPRDETHPAPCLMPRENLHVSLDRWPDFGSDLLRTGHSSGGWRHLSYDRMASLLAPYDSPEVLAVARELDSKIEDLLRESAG
jgi:hypothetical protein